MMDEFVDGKTTCQKLLKALMKPKGNAAELARLFTHGNESRARVFPLGGGELRQSLLYRIAATLGRVATTGSKAIRQAYRIMMKWRVLLLVYYYLCITTCEDYCRG
jgi:hypothetical protein